MIRFFAFVLAGALCGALGAVVQGTSPHPRAVEGDVITAAVIAVGLALIAAYELGRHDGR